jgi:hypothetical protein
MTAGEYGGANAECPRGEPGDLMLGREAEPPPAAVPRRAALHKTTPRVNICAAFSTWMICSSVNRLFRIVSSQLSVAGGLTLPFVQFQGGRSEGLTYDGEEFRTPLTGLFSVT